MIGFFRYSLLFVAFLSVPLLAQPCFDSYLEADVFTGKVEGASAPVEDDKFAKIMSEAVKNPVNFSGHYIVFFYSCGGGCITAGVIDAMTGSLVADFPDNYIAGDEPETFKTEFRANSRLIRIEGVSAYDDSGLAVRWYEFVNNSFKPVASE